MREAQGRAAPAAGMGSFSGHMSLETIHPGVWIFLAVASAAIIWFLGKSTLDEERGKAVGWIEKLAGYVVIALLVAFTAAAVILFVKEVWEPL